MELQNKNPLIHEKFELSKEEKALRAQEELDMGVTDNVDALEVFDIVRGILDPEHPLTLEQLNVVNLEDIEVKGSPPVAKVWFTPTIPNCSSASLIGLIIYIKLKECLPAGFKFRVKLKPGSHDLEEGINKQLGDKERVCAAFENEGLRKSLRQKLVDSQEYDRLLQKFL